MKFRLSDTLVLFVSLFLLAAKSPAFEPPSPAPLPNFDKRTDGLQAGDVVSGNQRAAVEQLRLRLPLARVDFYPVTGAPKMISAGQVSNAFNPTLVDNSVPDGHQTVTVTASAPLFTNGSASIFVIDDESPPPPSNPRPGHLAVNVPANTNLMWNNGNGTSGELILNGGFETGTFTNWLKQNIQNIGGLGDFVINNGSYDPPGSEVPTPPFAGSFSVVSEQTGGGTHVIYQDITLAPGTSSAVLTWTDRIRNFGAQFAANQYFHVEIRGTNNSLIQVAFTTNPGDPLTNNWVTRNFNLSPYIGQTIRIAFVEVDNLGFFNVHLDNISVQVGGSTGSGSITNDVYFGTNPTPGPAEFKGSTTNSSWTLPLLSPLTTYYWQIVAHKGGTATGPVWQFTTKGVDHFDLSSVASPKFVNVPFPLAVTAKDAFNSIVSNFTGTVSLRAGGGSGPGEIFRANFESGLQGFMVSNTFGLGNGLWHLSMGRAAQTGHSPSNSIYYGTGEGLKGGGTYNNGLANEGIITSPTIDLSAASAPLTLSFNCMIQSEPGTAWDHATVEISTNNGASYAVICGNNQGGVLFGTDSGGLWIVVTNNISSYAGKQIKLRLHFNTIDKGANNYEGWYVDDIVIFSGNTPAPIAITPTNSSPFTNGSWAGNITALQLATNVVLRADDGSGHTGSSNPFDVTVTNDISISILDSPDPVSVGASLTYTLTVANNGPSAATGVSVTNLLPASTAFISAISSQGTCTQSGGVVTCDLGVIPGGTNATIAIVVVPTVAGTTLTNSATVSRVEVDPYLGNNAALVTTVVTTPAISIADASLVEGNVGTTNMVFTLTLAAASAQTITVNYATANGGAVAGTDYVGTNGVLTFLPGITNGTLAVKVMGDTVIETDETFFVNLSNPVNGTLGRSQGVGTIINDDGFPGQVDHFTWSVIGSPQYANVPFGVTINAWDALNNPVTDFTGTVSLSSTSNSVVPIASDNFTNGIWSGNVAVLNRATNAVLVADDGNGHLGLSNPFDVVPANMAPVILLQPTNQTVFVGDAAAFSVVADGTPPLNFLWACNGTNISGATNTTLTLTNVQLSQAGNYAVLVTNLYGSILSSNAMLTVNPPPPVPVIFGFNPISGSVGTSVTISGTNFSPVSSNNIVYFGAVRAVVTGASVTNLVVMVPAGAIYAPITETVNGLTAYANQPFMPTFAGDGSGISISSFAPRQDLLAGNNSFHVIIADIDGDGKPDLVVANVFGNSISVYRNISTNGSLTAASFAPRVDFATTAGTYSPSGLAVADVDGDGKLDIITTDYSYNIVSIFRNTSTPGNISTNSFATRVDLATGAQPQGVEVRDIDGDGKPDLLVANSGDGTVAIYRNIGVVGNLTTNSFAPKVDIATGSGCQGVAAGDLDGDGKPDVVTVNNGDGTLSLLRNISTPGSITTNSFAAKVDLPALASSISIAIGDMDGDGKLDLVVSSFNLGQAVSVYRNTSTPGSFTTNSFAPRVDFGLGGWGNGVAIGDLDGDGKPDVAVVTQIPDQLSLFKNTSTPGSFTSSSFAARVDFSAGWNPNGVVIGDLDGDGRPDIVFANQYDSTISIYQNVVPLGGSPPSITTQPTNQTVAVGGTATFSVTASGSLPLSYQWNFNETNILGATNTTLTLTNVQLSQAGNYAVLVTNAYGSVTSSNAVLTVNLPPPCAPVSSGMVSWWSAEGNADDIVGVNNGMLVGGASFAAGEVGQAFSFDGSSGYVSIPDSPSLDSFTTSITIELWLKVNQLTANSDWMGIVTKGNSSWRLMGTTFANTVYLGLDGVNPSRDLFGTRNVNDGQWHHVAAVYDGTNMFLYVDGTLDVSQPATGLIAQNSSPVCIGANAQAWTGGGIGTGYFFNGLIDEVSLYNRALTASEIELIYITGIGGKCPVPPSITTQPTNQTVNAGTTATLVVSVTGTQPLNYQWNFNGTNIAGATNTSLILTNVQIGQAGNYTVLVTNLFGSVLSSNAILVVTLDHFAWNPIPSPRFVNTPFSVVIRAQDMTNGLFTNFTGTAILGTTNGVAVTPPVSGNFIQGVWTGAVVISQTASNLMLRADDGFGHFGLANPINVVSLPWLGMLRSGNIALYMWPVGYSGFVLETSGSLSPATWVVVPYSPIQIGDQYLLPLDMTGTNGFYRLRFPGP